MRKPQILGVVLGLALAASQGVRSTLVAQAPPNPYRIVEGWAQLPDGAKMGAVGKVAIAPDGMHIWAVVRCEPLYD